MPQKKKKKKNVLVTQSKLKAKVPVILYLAFSLFSEFFIEHFLSSFLLLQFLFCTWLARRFGFWSFSHLLNAFIYFKRVFFFPLLEYFYWLEIGNLCKFLAYIFLFKVNKISSTRLLSFYFSLYLQLA